MSKARKFLTIALLALTVALAGAACAPEAGMDTGAATTESPEVEITAGQAPSATTDGRPMPPEGHGGHAADPMRALPGLLTNIGIVALIIAAVQGVQWLADRRGSRRGARRIEAASPLG